MNIAISMCFNIAAGRYEDQGEKNYKYCNSANTIAEALAQWRLCEGYDFAEMELVVECDGAQSRIAIFGGQDEETWMRMRIAGLWMKATEKSFADPTGSWEEQLDEIESEISCLRKHNGALRQQNERAHKRVKELEQQVAQDNETWMRMRIAGLWMKATEKSFADVAASWEEQLDEIESIVEARCAPTPWQAIHVQFSNGLLTWTEAFDALMSQCGMPMEEALSCLAENFDRRPAINTEEV